MKVNKRMLNNFVFWILIFGLIVIKAPALIYHFSLSDTPVPIEIRKDIESNKKTYFPHSTGPSIVIYWASWCAPCKLEMARLKSSVESGSIPGSRVYAVNIFEPLKTITDFLKTNKYPFKFVNGGRAEEIFKITATPTTVILIDSKIYSVSEGLSLVGIWKTEYLFRHFISL
jgi:cytochrome c biogenesis protein CcmG, thiol:disulfide interchange protein DsbE